MSQPAKFSTPVFVATTLALLALVVFYYAGIYFLLVFVPLVVYFLLHLNSRVKDLERRLGEKDGSRPQS